MTDETATTCNKIEDAAVYLNTTTTTNNSTLQSDYTVGVARDDVRQSPYIYLSISPSGIHK